MREYSSEDKDIINLLINNKDKISEPGGMAVVIIEYLGATDYKILSDEYWFLVNKKNCNSFIKKVIFFLDIVSSLREDCYISLHREFHFKESFTGKIDMDNTKLIVYKEFNTGAYSREIINDSVIFIGREDYVLLRELMISSCIVCETLIRLKKNKYKSLQKVYTEKQLNVARAALVTSIFAILISISTSLRSCINENENNRIQVLDPKYEIKE